MGLGVPLFLAVWIAMTVATMFPAVAPMVLMFARIGAARRTSGRVFVPTSLFVGGYLVVWTALGVVAYTAALGAEALAARVDVLVRNAGLVAGALIVIAGAFQFSRLKDRCLSACRSPLAFVTQYWREGCLGAVRMGVRHGWHCAGCCWALMMLMFPLGVMNIAALAGVTALVYAEKVLPHAHAVRQVAGALLIAYGLLVIVDPSLLPGSPTHTHFWGQDTVRCRSCGQNDAQGSRLPVHSHTLASAPPSATLRTSVKCGATSSGPEPT
jgi:predicted metal-binding membrane protein